MKTIMLLLGAGVIGAKALAGLREGGIETAIRHYFAAGDTNSSAELRAAFHPATMMFWAGPDGALQSLTQPQWQERLDQATTTSRALRRDIQWVDVVGDTAVAALHSDFPTFQFQDYVLLARTHGQWQIIAKVFQRIEGTSHDGEAKDTREGAHREIEEVLQTKFQAMDNSDGGKLGRAYHARGMSFAVTDQQLVSTSVAEWQARFDAAKASGKGLRKGTRSIRKIESCRSVAVAEFVHDYGTETMVDHALLVKSEGQWRMMALTYAQQP